MHGGRASLHELKYFEVNTYIYIYTHIYIFLNVVGPNSWVGIFL